MPSTESKTRLPFASMPVLPEGISDMFNAMPVLPSRRTIAGTFVYACIFAFRVLISMTAAMVSKRCVGTKSLQLWCRKPLSAFAYFRMASVTMSMSPRE